MTYQPSVRTRARPVRHCCLAAAMAVVIAILTAGALAAADYPTKPVRVFVPYGPGGVGDLTMRLLADKLGEQLKQQFVIENRPGAGGIASATQVLRAPADGYTLGEIGNGQAISASLFTQLPFDVLKDFTPVSVAASFEMLLAVPGNSPYKSLKDVVDAAKKIPESSISAPSIPAARKTFRRISSSRSRELNLRSSPIARRPSWSRRCCVPTSTSGSTITPDLSARLPAENCGSSRPRGRNAIPCSKTSRPRRKAASPNTS